MLPLIAALYVGLNLWMGHHLPSINTGFGFWNIPLKESMIISVVLGPGLVVINAILLNWAFNRNGFKEKNNYLPALLFLIFSSYFHSFYFLNGFGIAQLFVVMTLVQLLRLDQNLDGRRTIFNAAFLLGVATTFHPFLLISVPFLFWMIWTLRPFIFRESALAVVGYAVPLLYAGTYSVISETKLLNKQFSSASLEWLFPDIYVITGGTFLLSIISIGAVIQKSQQSSIRLKKIFRLHILMVIFLGLLASMEFLAFQKIEPISGLLIVLVFFMPYGFGEKMPKTVPTVIFYLLFIFSVSKFFVPFEL